MLSAEYIWFIAGLFTIWFLPNTIENFSRYRIGIDVFGWKKVRKKGVGTFRFNYPSIIFCGVLAMLGLIFTAQSTAEFLYFDF
jgi:hypothetical protein